MKEKLGLINSLKILKITVRDRLLMRRRCHGNNLKEIQAIFSMKCLIILPYEEEGEKRMFEIVPSQVMRQFYDEIGFEFTDFQKATLIWNAPGKNRQEILDALKELADETKDSVTRQQILERLAYEEKIYATCVFSFVSYKTFQLNLTEISCRSDLVETVTYSSQNMHIPMYSYPAAHLKKFLRLYLEGKRTFRALRR